MKEKKKQTKKPQTNATAWPNILNNVFSKINSKNVVNHFGMRSHPFSLIVES